MSKNDYIIPPEEALKITLNLKSITEAAEKIGGPKCGPIFEGVLNIQYVLLDAADRKRTNMRQKKIAAFKAARNRSKGK